MNTDQRHKELDLIQAVITRMAANSFEVKKWMIGIVSALLVFKKEELLGGQTELWWILLFPILSFWYLNAFFLRTEKLYRNLYQWIVENRSWCSDFLYDLKPGIRPLPADKHVNLNDITPNVWAVAFSKTLWPMYLIPALLVLVIGSLPKLPIYICH